MQIVHSVHQGYLPMSCAGYFTGQYAGRLIMVITTLNDIVGLAESLCPISQMFTYSFHGPKVENPFFALGIGVFGTAEDPVLKEHVTQQIAQHLPNCSH